jgi:hypothetical protein
MVVASPRLGCHSYARFRLLTAGAGITFARRFLPALTALRLLCSASMRFVKLDDDLPVEASKRDYAWSRFGRMPCLASTSLQ